MIGIICFIVWMWGTDEPYMTSLPVPVTPYQEEDEDDTRDLPWIASWSPLDRIAREGQNCAVKYKEAGRDGIDIITTSKSCEDGLPHTRTGDRIMIPDSIPDPMRTEIIAHELVHIYQTRFPEDWSEFYTNSWGFQLFAAPPPGMPASIRSSRRSNPDTWRTPWCCWRGRYWPVAIYNNTVSPTLRDSSTVWFDSQENRVLTEAPDEWTEFFGSVSQPEHPNEIAAVLIVSSDRSYEAGRRLQNWYQLHRFIG